MRTFQVSPSRKLVNICIVTVDLYSTAALLLNSTAPFSDRTYLVANGNYRIGFDDMVVAMQSGKHLFCIPFFDCVPTGIQSFRRYLKRVSSLPICAQKTRIWRRLSEAGFAVRNATVDVSSRASVHALVENA
jgi:hypothetical protein